MSNVIVDTTVVVASWSVSALLTLALATVTPQEPPKKEKEEKVIVTEQNHIVSVKNFSASLQIQIIEQKLEDAEDDLEEISKIIEEKKALEAAKKLDAEERGKRK